MTEPGYKTLKKSVIAFIVVVVLAIASYAIYYYEWGGGKSPAACKCVELIEKVQGGTKLTDSEMEDYQNCAKKYGNKFAAETACWNERNKK